MNVKDLVSKMTLEEKAGLCSGKDFWRTKAVERLGIPSVMVSDGPHGLRKQDGEGDHVGVNDSITAVCFPAGCATSCTFDRALMYEMGEAIAKECQAEDVSVILGPAMNIKRSPLCGRNFEYISEDPYVAGELAASYTSGVQSHNIGVSVKHFAANNQEFERMYGSSEIDERTFREIYLTPFEIAVKKSKPWTVMCSYNRINGVYSSENRRLLTDILRDEWGFDGYVMTDWGAICDRVLGLDAGLDLEMPASGGETDKEIVEAVKSGRLEESILDKAVTRMLNILYRYIENREKHVFDREADHKKATEVAKQCIVLLKNDNNMLPFKEQDENVAFIGGFAEKPRYQGSGSSHINAYRVDSTLESAGRYGKITYAEGFTTEADVYDEKLAAEAVAVAKNASKVVIFAGLPAAFESEAYDRAHMRLPDCQNRLIDEILKVQKNVVIVLHNGSPVEMPWVDGVSAIVEAYLGGEGVAEAIADTLYGKCNPCGKLAESFPLRLQDNPSYLNFPGAGGKVHYTEGVFVGYRYYDSKEMDVLFPFGYGLSYTTFELSNLKLSAKEMQASGTITVTVDVKNTGSMAGKEVVQLYISDSTGVAVRPVKELKGFEAVRLEPGETKTVTMTLDKRSFAWYSEELSDWYAATGDYKVLVGNSSRGITLEDTVHYISDAELPFIINEHTQFGDLLKHPKTGDFVRKMAAENPMFGGGGSDDPDWARMMEAMMRFMPLRALCSFQGVTRKEIAGLVAQLNSLLGK